MAAAKLRGGQGERQAGRCTGCRKGDRRGFKSEAERAAERERPSERRRQTARDCLWLTKTKMKPERERREDKCLNWQLIPQILEGFSEIESNVGFSLGCLIDDQ